MTKTAFISAIFASYVAVMFAIAAIPGETPEMVSQAATEQTLN